MARPEDIRRDLPADLEPAERDGLAEAGVRLAERRPLPDPNFRGALRRLLLDAPARRLSMSPRAIRALSASYMCSGAVLLAVAALGLAGSGPFAA
jgi:hypothetical protein